MVRLQEMLASSEINTTSQKRRFYALDVAVNNPRAQKLYDALGFKVANERQFGKQGSIPNVRRMEIDLCDRK